ncbi:NfeD family protein [Chloroflexota bacterium]
MTKKGEISTKKAWLLILVSLIDDIIILVVIGLGLWYFKVKLPLWALITLGLVLGGFIFVRTWAVLPSLRRKKITGSEGMIGLVCEVVESLTPNGVVRVSGEYWQANSVDGEVETGEEVEVIEINRLILEVRRRVSWEE